MKLDKSAHDSLIFDNKNEIDIDIDNSINKLIPNPKDCFEEHCMINDPYYAMNYFRKIIMLCFDQEYKILNQLKENNVYEYEATFKALEYSGLLKNNESKEEHSNDNGVSISVIHKVSTILTNKGLRYYNDICDDNIWNKALNAFKKNDIEPRFPYVSELCSYLRK